MSRPPTTDALLAEALAPEGLSGAAYTSRATAVYDALVCESLNEAVLVAREDVVLTGGHRTEDSPAALLGGRVVAARRGGRLATVVAADPVTLTGLRSPTGFVPLCAVHAGTATVLPVGTVDDPASVAVLGPFSGTPPTTGLHPLLLQAADKGARLALVQRAHEAAALAVDAAGPGADVSLGTLVASTAPTLGAPVLTGLPTVPALPTKPTVTLPAAPAAVPAFVAPTAPTAPTLTAPTDPGAIAVPADLDATAKWSELTNEDPEQVGAAVAAQRATIEHFSALVGEAQGRYRTQAEVNATIARTYESEVSAFRAQVEAALAPLQRSRADVEVYAASVRGAVAVLEGYAAEVQAYAAAVQARATERGGIVQAWLAEHVQGALARYQTLEGAANAAFRATTEAALGQAGEGRSRWQVRLQDLARVRDGLAQTLKAAADERDRAFALIAPAPPPQPR